MGRGDITTQHQPSAQKDRTKSKKKTYGYRERNYSERRLFLRQLAIRAKDSLVYVDETGIDDNEDYAYGWCERGKQFEALKLGIAPHGLA